MTKKITIEVNMTEEEAEKDWNRLLQKWENDAEEWARKYFYPLTDKQKIGLALCIKPYDGFPPKPKHPNYINKWEEPHDYLKYSQAKYGFVWVKSFGWMNYQDWQDILNWAEEDNSSNWAEEDNSSKG